MQAIQKVDERLSSTGLEYESYLSGIGRNLFYTVASSYLSIYLGVLFLLISNTVIGLKYLMQQHACRQRYRTLLMLGAGTRGTVQVRGAPDWHLFPAGHWRGGHQLHFCSVGPCLAVL